MLKQIFSVFFLFSIAYGLSVSSPSGCGGDSELVGLLKSISVLDHSKILQTATHDAQYIETPNYGISEYPGDLNCK